MIKKVFALKCCLILSVATAFGQSIKAETKLPEKKFDHYAGIQINQVFKQILNLTNNSAPIDNPYLLSYRLVYNRYGIGINGGMGVNYTFSQNKLQSAIENQTSDVSFRAGLDKRFIVGSRFEIFCGIDFINHTKLSKTTTQQVTVFGGGFQTDSTVTKTTGTERGSGFGPRVALNFSLTNRIQIGTETSVYYFSGKNNQNTFFQDFVINSGTTEIFTDNTNSELKTKNVTFAVPVAIYLHVKF